MRLIDADALIKTMVERKRPENGVDSSKERYRYMQWLADYWAIKEAPTIEPRHGLLIPDATLPRKGCYHCMFREGNLCRFLPASVPVVECAKRNERHKECPLVEV